MEIEYWLLVSMCILTVGNIIVLVATVWISVSTASAQTSVLHMTVVALNEQKRFMEALAESRDG